MNKHRESLPEFEMISRYFSRGLRDSASGLVNLSVGDDCAVLTVPAGFRLALSMDTVVEGRHFPSGAAAEDIAYRAIAVAASDLAAMGAKPLAVTLALTLPAAERSWVESFSAGLYAALNDFDLSLIGGDTTQGSLTVTVQVHGLLPNDQALLRSSARVGDSIVVSGTLGDGAAALAWLQGQLQLDTAQQQFLQQRFYRPQPRLSLGQQLLSVASSAIDISDGLLADLGHIVSSSGVGAHIYADKLPLSDILRHHNDYSQALRWALTGGDDYELCFSVSAEKMPLLESISRDCNIPLTVIGEMVAGSGVECRDAGGELINFDGAGYQHFAQ